jgi:hypothetical protein
VNIDRNTRVKPKEEMKVEYPTIAPRVRNLSLTGAFIEDKRPLSKGRVLPVKLWVLPNEAITVNAMVRRVEDGEGMGVEFLGMSDADHTRLRRSVGEVPSTDL